MRSQAIVDGREGAGELEADGGSRFPEMVAVGTEQFQMQPEKPGERADAGCHHPARDVHAVRPNLEIQRSQECHESAAAELPLRPRHDHATHVGDAARRRDHESAGLLRRESARREDDPSGTDGRPAVPADEVHCPIVVSVAPVAAPSVLGDGVRSQPQRDVDLGGVCRDAEVQAAAADDRPGHVVERNACPLLAKRHPGTVRRWTRCWTCSRSR
jgi:hypothetical protein